MRIEINIIETVKLFVIASRESFSLGSKGDTPELSKLKHQSFGVFTFFIYDALLFKYLFLTWSEFHTVTVQLITSDSWVLTTCDGLFISTSLLAERKSQWLPKAGPCPPSAARVTRLIHVCF